MTRLITALDFATREEALAFAKRLDPALTRVKVGNELFTLAGPALVETLQERGFEVFLDLKYHDIPNTVGAAVARAAGLGVWMVNVHASGGRRMLEAARAAVEPYRGEQAGTRLIGVTVLTSLTRSDLVEIGLDVEPARHVQRLAALTRETGLDGVVCSPLEIALIREIALLKKPANTSGAESVPFLTVTPGIRPDTTGMTRPAGTTATTTPGERPLVDDQRRILSPREAILAGADHLVIGRPITRAVDPMWTLASLVSETDDAYREREARSETVA